jgi:hypothetical protein
MVVILNIIRTSAVVSWVHNQKCLGFHKKILRIVVKAFQSDLRGAMALSTTTLAITTLNKKTVSITTLHILLKHKSAILRAKPFYY